MSRVPFELSDYIIDFLHADSKALNACSLTCRSWAPAARFHLFHSVALQNRDYMTPFQRLLDTSPDLGWYVRQLTVAKFVDTGKVAPAHDQQLPTVVEQALPQIFMHIPSLRTLSLSHVDMRCITGLAGLPHPSVTVLSLSYCQFDEFADIPALVACFPHLTDLALAGLTWREETRVCEATPLPTLRSLDLGRDMDSERLFAWFEAAGFHTSVTRLAARCASESDADLVGPFIKLAGGSLQELDLDWSITGDKTIILPQNVSLGDCTALDNLRLRFPVHYCTSLPWVTSLLATLNATAVRSISCDIRLLGHINALDWDGLSKLLSSDGYRGLKELRFGVNLWPGVHKDFEEVAGLVRERLALFDKKGMVHITKV
ncbi:hypothetical protein L226DRAFT_607244 [Lentinus tigrinus ALCF2SS1-7]|uniref:uncharacterized protein n=1 Tax=Lentinus tigrinus ALCF2SS1-7 TaxID=1328758 RepID=UPI001166321E|nr:hypothetical protein L226DRAFT_607244 [Lentinus tigrinus ALCF2SS1-7]